MTQFGVEPRQTGPAWRKIQATADAREDKQREQSENIFREAAEAALRQCKDDVTAGVNALQKRVMADPKLKDVVLAKLIRSACYDEISGLIRSRRETVWNSAQPSADQQKARVRALAGGVSLLVSFEVPGVPIAKGRPRFVRATGRTYTPAKTAHGERGIAQFAAEAMAGRPLIEVPCELSIVTRHLPPKTRTKAERALPWADFKGTRPDADNYVKAVLDACNGVVWRDDSLVAVIHAAKVFSEQPGISVTVRAISFVSWPVCRDLTVAP